MGMQRAMRVTPGKVIALVAIVLGVYLIVRTVLEHQAFKRAFDRIPETWAFAIAKGGGKFNLTPGRYYSAWHYNDVEKCKTRVLEQCRNGGHNACTILRFGVKGV